MSDLEKMGGLIDKLLGRWGLAEMELFLGVRDRWTDIAGKQWVMHARPVMLRSGVLTVEASKEAATILRYDSGELLRTLDRTFGEGRIRKVEIRAIPPGGGTG